MGFKRAIVLLATTPFWVACQNSTSPSGAESTAAQLEQSSHSSEAGIWLVAPLAAQLHAYDEVVRCGEAISVPQGISVDATGRVEELPRVDVAGMMMPEASVPFVPSYNKFTSLEAKGGVLTAVHQNEQTVRFVRSTEAEVSLALQKQKKCVAQLKAADRENKTPQTLAEWENRAVLAKFELNEAVNTFITTGDMGIAALNASATAAAGVGAKILDGKHKDTVNTAFRQAFEKEPARASEKWAALKRMKLSHLKQPLPDLIRKARGQRYGAYALTALTAIALAWQGYHAYGVIHNADAPEIIAQNESLVALLKMPDSDLRAHVAANPEDAELLIEAKTKILQ